MLLAPVVDLPPDINVIALCQLNFWPCYISYAQASAVSSHSHCAGGMQVPTCAFLTCATGPNYPQSLTYLVTYQALWLAR